MVDPAIRARSLALYEAHTGWALAQVAAGVDSSVPAGRLSPSDYNQHVPDLEASGAAEDAFAARAAAAIMGL